MNPQIFFNIFLFLVSFSAIMWGASSLMFGREIREEESFLVLSLVTVTRLTGVIGWAIFLFLVVFAQDFVVGKIKFLIGVY